MQPTFLPWLGYFALIHQVDDFVFLNNVQFSKQSWQCRNLINGPNGPVLLTLPVHRKPSFPLISDTRLVIQNLEAEIVPRVQGCLGTAPYWQIVKDIICQALAGASEGLQHVNTKSISQIASVLNIQTKFSLSSDIDIKQCEKEERLLAICKHLNADEYLSPIGAVSYLRQNNPFSDTTVKLRFLNFTHPKYEQRWIPFRPQMSIIDALAWLGPTRTREAILSAINNPFTLEDLNAISFQ